MHKIINITRDYTLDESFEESVKQLDTIVTAPANDPGFVTFGTFVSDNPPAFLLMARWVSVGKATFAKMASTRLLVQLVKVDNKTRITITTKTNPIWAILFIGLMAGFVIKLLDFRDETSFRIAGVFFLLAILVMVIDRIIKNILIAGFETDMETETKAHSGVC